MGRKMYQSRRGLDEMKSEISRPIREHLEAPLRDAADTARRAAEDAHHEVRSSADVARSEIRHAGEITESSMTIPKETPGAAGGDAPASATTEIASDVPPRATRSPIRARRGHRRSRRLRESTP